MSSIATCNTPYVRFDDELAKPPLDRHRIDGLVYPRVAQIKGEANRQNSFDLYWKYDYLSAASRIGTAGTVEVKEDERIAVSPRSSQVQYPTSPPRSPRTLTQRIGEMTTPKLPSTPLSNLLQTEQALSIFCTPPLLCSSRLTGDSSSLGGNSAYSSSASSTSSSELNF